MLIAIPKEILPEEKRVAANPDTVKKYIALGFTVQVEKGAGQGVLISDEEYRSAGAAIATDVEEMLAAADIVLKVKQPVFNERKNKHEVDMLRANSILITFLHPAAPGNHEMIRNLQQKNITALTMDSIPRISRAQRMDALSSMSAVTGYKSVIMAANMLPKFIPMIGTAIGTIKPAHFLVIGVGVVGLQAIATAKRLGGVVKTLDIRKNACVESESLGGKVIEFRRNLRSATGAMQNPWTGSGSKKNAILLRVTWERPMWSSSVPLCRVKLLPSSSPGRWSQA